MALGIWEFNATRADEAGIVRTIPGAQVTVRRESDGELAPLFLDVGGGSPLSNPFEADSLGGIRFYAPIGALYSIEISDPPLERTLRHQAVIGGGGAAGGGSDVTPEAFGAVGDGSSDDTGALQAAGHAAIADGRALLLSRRYRVTSQVLWQAGITIRGPGTVYADAAITGAAIDVYLPPLAVVTVLEVDDAAEFDYTGTNPEAPFPTTRLRVSNDDALLVEIGAVAKLISDDHSVGVEENKLQGEFVRVGHKADAGGGNTWLYLLNRTLHTFTTSPRLAVLDQDQRVVVDGVRFDANWSAGVAGNWNFAHLRVAGAVAPIMRGVHATNIFRAGVEPLSCVGELVEGCSFIRGRNAVDIGITGYGVRAAGCGSGRYVGLYGLDVRHVYTTVHQFTDTGDPWTYGRNIAPVITGGNAFACNHAAWDTHGDAWFATFVNCSATAGYWGHSRNAPAVQFRGKRCRAEGCTAIGQLNVGYVAAQEFADQGGDHEFIDCLYEGTGVAFNCNPVVGHIRAFFRGFTARSSFPSIIQSDGDCTIELDGGRLISTATTDAFRFVNLRETAAATFRVKRTVFDRRDTSAPFMRVVAYRGAGHVVEFEGVEVENGGQAWSGLIASADDAPFGDITFRFTADADFAPSQPGGIGNVGDGSDVTGTLTVNGGRDWANAVPPVLGIGAEDATIDVSRVAAPIIHRRIQGNSATSRITRIEPGALLGQILVLANATGAAEAVELVHDLGEHIAVGGNDLEIEPGGAVALIWDGAHWRGFGTLGAQEAI